MLQGDLDLTFDLAVMTLTFKILSRPCVANHNVQEVNIWLGYYWMQLLGVQHHGVTLI